MLIHHGIVSNIYKQSIKILESRGQYKFLKVILHRNTLNYFTFLTELLTLFCFLFQHHCFKKYASKSNAHFVSMPIGTDIARYMRRLYASPIAADINASQVEISWLKIRNCIIVIIEDYMSIPILLEN